MLINKCAEIGGSAAGKAGAIVGAFGFGEMVLTAGIPVTLGVLAITNFLGEDTLQSPYKPTSPFCIWSVNVSLVTESRHAHVLHTKGAALS